MLQYFHMSLLLFTVMCRQWAAHLFDVKLPEMRMCTFICAQSSQIFPRQISAGQQLKHLVPEIFEKLAVGKVLIRSICKGGGPFNAAIDT